MNPLTCHCGAIHFNKLIDALFVPAGQRGHADTEVAIHISDPENSLRKYHFKEGALREKAFCKHCGAEIYAINRSGEVVHNPSSEAASRPNYAGVLNYGF
ncbi:hypothetical protein [Microbulbifer sp. VVAC002]|uniref:hypothetical protein n=1 Tax=Microbulbifer sp. VVAC002 TaxID=3243387 RepID=UPI00403A5F4C